MSMSCTMQLPQLTFHWSRVLFLRLPSPWGDWSSLSSLPLLCCWSLSHSWDDNQWQPTHYCLLAEPSATNHLQRIRFVCCVQHQLTTSHQNFIEVHDYNKQGNEKELVWLLMSIILTSRLECPWVAKHSYATSKVFQECLKMFLCISLESIPFKICPIRKLHGISLVCGSGEGERT